MSEHIGLPLTLGDGRALYDAQGEVVAYFSGHAPVEIQEYIAHACNAFPELTERLFDTDKYVNGHKTMCHFVHYGATDPRGACDCGFEELRAATAKATT